ncbi:CD209 antigen-like isoform X2 [Biomphalaria glabrata]|nr:CD209 antigen-like isoform X2 [Biomphalaria glabrata]
MTFTGGKMCCFWSVIPKTFADAKADCEARGARLAVFKGADKMAFLISQLSIWARDIWIGLDDIQKEGTFVWHDGTILYKHEYHPLYFSNDNPDNDDNQDCVDLSWSYWKFDDDSCSKSKNYVCEKVL